MTSYTAFELASQMANNELAIGGVSFRTAPSINERFWYLCTPYTNYPKGPDQAYQDACKMTAFLSENGLFVFSPIVHSYPLHTYQNKDLQFDYDFWLTIDFKFIKMSKGLIVCTMDGWKESYGIQKEIKLVQNELQKPIIYTEFMKLPLNI